jgi:cysteine desulfurase
VLPIFWAQRCSATEANNLALRGVTKAVQKEFVKIRPHIIILAIEHSSIIKTAEDLMSEGVDVDFLAVNKEGVLDAESLKNLIKDTTILVSVGLANNEIGVIQPVGKVAGILADVRKLRSESKNKIPIYLHTDAVQALNYLPTKVDELGVDLMTFSAHKIYGPKGIGALYVRYGVLLKPVITGGSQEYRLRAGTENVANIVGFARACQLAQESLLGGENKRIEVLIKRLLKGLKEILPGIEINGSLKERLPNNLNLFLPGIKTEEALIALDLAGVALSIGSACSARAKSPSHVLAALGLSKEKIDGSVRISLGRGTSEEEIDEFLEIFKRNVLPLREKKRAAARI